jgi:hypothetical protein
MVGVVRGALTLIGLFVVFNAAVPKAFDIADWFLSLFSGRTRPAEPPNESPA